METIVTGCFDSNPAKRSISFAINFLKTKKPILLRQAKTLDDSIKEIADSPLSPDNVSMTESVLLNLEKFAQTEWVRDGLAVIAKHGTDMVPDMEIRIADLNKL